MPTKRKYNQFAPPRHATPDTRLKRVSAWEHRIADMETQKSQILKDLNVCKKEIKWHNKKIRKIVFSVDEVTMIDPDLWLDKEKTLKNMRAARDMFENHCVKYMRKVIKLNKLVKQFNKKVVNELRPNI